MTDAMIARYLDRRMSDSERERFEGHLAECTECREAVVESEKLLKQVRPRPGMKTLIALSVAAVVLVAVRLEVIPRNPQFVSGTRAMTPVSGALGVYGPIGEVSSRGLRFLWSPIVGGVSYRLVVTDASSHPVWSTTSADTTVALPANVDLRAGERYFWIVDGLASNGITHSTGVREFRVAK
jgi:anti-sigma factor RsiW